MAARQRRRRRGTLRGTDGGHDTVGRAVEVGDDLDVADTGRDGLGTDVADDDRQQRATGRHRVVQLGHARLRAQRRRLRRTNRSQERIWSRIMSTTAAMQLAVDPHAADERPGRAGRRPRSTSLLADSRRSPTASPSRTVRVANRESTAPSSRSRPDGQLREADQRGGSCGDEHDDDERRPPPGAIAAASTPIAASSASRRPPSNVLTTTRRRATRRQQGGQPVDRRRRRQLASQRKRLPA